MIPSLCDMLLSNRPHHYVVNEPRKTCAPKSVKVKYQPKLKTDKTICIETGCNELRVVHSGRDTARCREHYRAIMVMYKEKSRLRK